MIKKTPIDLIAKSFNSVLSEIEKKELETWRATPKNEKKYKYLCTKWNEAITTGSQYDPDKERLWKTLKIRQFHKRIIYSFSGVAAMTIIVAGIYHLADTHFWRNEDRIVFVENVTGKVKTTLPDGTIVWLNSNSSLTYDANIFGDKTRDVTLNGEAYFTVHHDKDCPFTVTSDSFTVKVTGTEFNIAETNSIIKVSLTEGSVSLESKRTGTSVHMYPGQIAECDKLSGNVTLKSGNVNMEKCWAQTSLTLQEKTLGEVCLYLSEWYGLKINIDNSLADTGAYSFTLTSESIEEILDVINDINPIKYKKLSADEYTITGF